MSSPRRRTRARPKARNPIEQLKAPWKPPHTAEVSWRAVQDIVRGERESPMAIEVTTSGEHAEVIVYAIHAKRFGIRRPDEEKDAEASELKDAFDYAKSHATVILRGDVGRGEAFCVSHRPDTDEGQCGMDCEYTDMAPTRDGFRTLLWSFLNQHDFWERMSAATPVVIDGAEPVTLNEAAIVDADQRALFRKLRDNAMGQADYYLTNADCVDEVTSAYLNAIVNAVLDNHYLRCVNESGVSRQAMPNGPGIAVAAEMKWREQMERLANLEDWEGAEVALAGENIREQFDKWLRSEVQYSTSAFNREEWDEVVGGPHESKLNAKWLRVCTWEQSTIDDQIEESVLEDHDGDNSSVVEALGRIDVDWDGASNEMTIACNVFWVFAIDVDDAVEKLDEIIAQYREVDE